MSSAKSPHCDLRTDSRFAALGRPQRLWVIGAVHGEAERLMDLHDRLYPHVRPGDRIIYTGNYGGHGLSPCETLDEVLSFRRGILALPGMVSDDFVYLRGGHEEMWEKLQQLQFAPNPHDTLVWMLDHGLTPTIESYGLRPRDGLNAANEGVMATTRWTAAVRNAVRRYPGHDIFQCQLRRAAFTALDSEMPVAYVHAGMNPGRSLQDQGDALWWGGQHGTGPCAPFQKLIRGFDPAHGGLHITETIATIDGGCGFDGALLAALFTPDGAFGGLIEV